MILLSMGKDPEYLTVGKTPLERVYKLPVKSDSITFNSGLLLGNTVNITATKKDFSC